jgi:hypothetical protein
VGAFPADTEKSFSLELGDQLRRLDRHSVLLRAASNSWSFLSIDTWFWRIARIISPRAPFDFGGSAQTPRRAGRGA